MSATDDKKIWDFLKGKGLNNYAIAGVIGNLYAESEAGIIAEEVKQNE